MTIGILALQGAFREHRLALQRLGATAREVRQPAHLDGLSGLIVPGGESTTMAKLMVAYGFDRALPAFHASGGAVWGTCAGAILVAREIVGRPEQPRLDLIDLTVDRNAYGRQVASFEADLEVRGMDAPFRAVFIRAPRIAAVGPDVTVLAQWHDDPVAVASDRAMATVFHPELSGDDRFHRLFLDRIERSVRGTAPTHATDGP
ncbi:MAG: pyridoxal 5'-phosphate synthase glutaminase subunit PdxT [Trueperaceae bacterium]